MPIGVPVAPMSFIISMLVSDSMTRIFMPSMSAGVTIGLIELYIERTPPWNEPRTRRFWSSSDAYSSETISGSFVPSRAGGPASRT